MAFDGAILQNQLYPKLAPNEALSESWVRMFVNKLQANQDNLIESTRLLVRNLEEDYQTADAYVVAEFTEEIGVLTTAQGAQAGRITTLEAQVQTAGTGLLARVSVTESAIVTLDGRVSAYYGIKVAAGTNIATIEAMASGGGVPSTVVITAGQIQLNGNVLVNGSVLTTSIAANAITTSVDYEDDSNVNVGSSWTDIGSASVPTPDAATRVLVSWSSYIDASTDGSLMEARILRDATVVWGPKSIAGNPPAFAYTFDTEGYIEYTPPFSGMVSAFDTDAPGAAGTYTYKIQFRVPGSVSTPWEATYRRFLATVFKR